MSWRVFIPICVILVFGIGVYYALEIAQALQALVAHSIDLLRHLARTYMSGLM
jgi:hypothetical protein